MSPASTLAKRRRRVVPVVVVADRVVVAEIEVIAETAEIEVDGRIRAVTKISRTMMIAKRASWVPVRAKRSDKVVDAMDVVVEIVAIVAIAAEIVSAVTVDAKSVVAAVIAESRASVVSAKSVHLSPVNGNSASRSWSTRRLASTLVLARPTESLEML
jgi:hypothetical protein